MSTDQDDRDFEAPWGGILKLTTVLLVAVLGSVSLGGWLLMPPRTPDLARALVVLVPALILLGAIPFVVRRFRVTRGALHIRRLFWSTTISFLGLQSVEVRPDAMRRAIRLLGNGGGFVFAGLFRSRDLGMFRAYVNDFKRTVILRFPGKTFVVSPDDPEAFADCVKQMTGCERLAAEARR